MSCGMPSVGQLDGLMQDWSADWARQHSFSNHYEALSRTIDAYYQADDARPRPVLNFEKILGEMVALSHWMTPAPLGNTLRQAAYGGAAPPQLNFRCPDAYGPAVEAMDQLSYILIKLTRYMRSRCVGLQPSNDSIRRYLALADGLNGAFDVGVYNLNYDTLALTAWPSAFTGFDAAGKFDAAAVHRRQDWGFIYHLHGSVHYSLNRLSGDYILWRSDLNSEFHDGPYGHPSNTASEGKTLPIA